MFKTHGKFPVVPFVLAAVCVFSVVAAFCADHPSAPAGNAPKVVAVTQVTHDGVIKTNLLSDGTNLYISESLAAHRFVAKVSLKSDGSSVLPTSLSNVQALDVSPDHQRILVSSSEN